MNKIIQSAVSLALLFSASLVLAADINIAVASNFTAAAKALASDFETRHGYAVRLSFGSTGKLYTQIYNGAPFAVFLAADEQRPQRATREGLAVEASRFTYALGKIALWSAASESAEALNQRLQQGHYRRIALANPKLAPYGAAAQQAIEELAEDKGIGKMVYGENIAQTHQFVATGNADLGIVALAQLTGGGAAADYWVVPEHLYTPIRQQAVLLNKGIDSIEALAFMAYLKQPEAQSIIERHGYGIE